MVEGARVRALVHTPARAVRIARLPVDLVFGDILDLKTIERASADCQIVIHCVYGNSGSAATRQQVTVQGTQNMLRAALAHGVERFVHISTVHVHGLACGERIDEGAPFRHEKGHEYAASKIKAEELVWDAWLDHGLPVAILRPAFVYGPYSQWWTVSPIQRLKAGEFYLIEGGRGICNPVYVDDAVQALVLAATHPRAVGEAFFIAAGAVTWRRFFGHYLRMAGVDQVPSWDSSAWRAAQFQRRLLNTTLGKVVAYLGSPRVRELAAEFPLLAAGLGLTRAVLPDRLQKRIVSQTRKLYRAKRWPVSPPGELEMKQFASRCVYCTDKAKEMLGYHPAVSLEQGIKYTEDWLHYVGLL